MPGQLIVLGVAIALSIIIVRIGAVALQMTGLEPSMARFQALSAFTGTGFTTHAAEEVVRNPQRRRIASVLIFLGYAGIVTVIATLVQTLQSTFQTDEDLNNWWLLLQLAGLMVALYLLYQLIIWPRLAAKIDRQIRAGLETGFGWEPAEVEEVLSAAEGWGIVRVRVPEDCKFANLTLAQSRPRDEGVLILAIERGNAVIPSPGAPTVILPGDTLLAYGRMEQLEELGRSHARQQASPATESISAGSTGKQAGE